ncbi:MAG: HNH endonuclease [Terracidiphilus sp.]|nr:HNH endonuclease [Terracidiphilus sp.]MDR3777048.1 HNH endonuclease [Terracidiphilus sp.]
MPKRITGKELNDRWNVGADDSRYSERGNWYAQLHRFPGALFDQNGYVLFRTKEEYQSCPYLNIRKQINMKGISGISAIPEYVRVIGTEDPDVPDVDLHSSSSGIEGGRSLKLHLFKERDRALVKRKKKSATSLNCEICRFSFEETYGGPAGAYCEVHHLVPISTLEEATKVNLEDLAILCANCHRVVHLVNPPYTLQEVRVLLRSR